LHSRGDARNAFGWDDVSRKFLALAGPPIGEASATQVVALMRDAAASADMPALWELQ
jgi:hypothetical protein